KEHNLAEIPKEILIRGGEILLISRRQVNLFSLNQQQKATKQQTIRDLNAKNSRSNEHFELLHGGNCKSQRFLSQEISEWQSSRKRELDFLSKRHEFQDEEYSDEEALLRYVEMISLESNE